jgi:hypothetical protein
VEYVIYSDESDDVGRYYSDFYGAAMLRADQVDPVSARLLAVKEKHRLGEVKWQKVTEPFLPNYVAFVNALFDELAAGNLKMRIMFTHNYRRPTALSTDHRRAAFLILYYQFLKHGFGLRYLSKAEGPYSLRLNLDRLPETKEQVAQFKSFLVSLNSWSRFADAGVKLYPLNIAEVDSRDHVIMQGVDLVLGSMQFRLNDKQKDKPPGAHRRGKRTRAKLTLFKEILRRIQLLYPRFNVGITTGYGGDKASRLLHPYRHWEFVPKATELDRRYLKP